MVADGSEWLLWVEQAALLGSSPPPRVKPREGARRAGDERRGSGYFAYLPVSCLVKSG